MLRGAEGKHESKSEVRQVARGERGCTAVGAIPVPVPTAVSSQGVRSGRPPPHPLGGALRAGHHGQQRKERRPAQPHISGGSEKVITTKVLGTVSEMGMVSSTGMTEKDVCAQQMAIRRHNPQEVPWQCQGSRDCGV